MTPDEFPPLPEPARIPLTALVEEASTYGFAAFGYTADQMHSYILADRAARGAEGRDAALAEAAQAIVDSWDHGVVGDLDAMIETLRAAIAASQAGKGET